MIHKYAILLIGLLIHYNGHLSGQVIVPLSIAPEGHLLIKAKINNISGNFILDTGGGITAVTKDFGSTLKGLKPLDGYYTGFRATGEKMDLFITTGAHVQIGSIILEIPTLSILNVNLGEIDGIISLTTFETSPFTIDFSRKQLIIETPQSLELRRKDAVIVQLQSDKSRGISLDIFAFLVLNDKLTLQFLLDSGAGNNVYTINSRYLSWLGIDSTNKILVSKRYKTSEFSEHSQAVFYSTNLAKLSFRDAPSIHTQNVKARFVDKLIYDGVTSINWIGHEITFDLHRSEMLVH